MQADRKLEDIQRDVDFANRYRMEYIKHMMSLSAGIFILSIAFMKDVVGGYSSSVFKTGLVLGWGSLILSLVGGIFHLKCWDRFYITYRKQKEIGDVRRKRINKWRIASEACQVAFFILGLLLIFLFSVINLVKGKP